MVELVEGGGETHSDQHRSFGHPQCSSPSSSNMAEVAGTLVATLAKLLRCAIMGASLWGRSARSGRPMS